MDGSLFVLILLVTVANTVLLVFLLLRSGGWKSQSPERALREELRAGREESSRSSKELREELSIGLKSANDSLVATLSSMSMLQQDQLAGFTNQLAALAESNQRAIDQVRNVLDSRVKELQEGNEKKLEEMRKTVDERLQDALEKRLGESFKLVSEQLEAVHRGLGEMQNLAVGVGDLKRVLTNVKLRGTWAEVQLGAILDEMLAPGQYEKNVRVNEDSSGVVEYAVRLPGPKNDPAACVWLPIDSKFPQEDYVRLQAAAEIGDAPAVQKASEALFRAVRDAAREIQEKYLNPPTTTDFAIMFLATEGLYAEVLRQPQLAQELQQRFRVTVAGPTTLSAVLNSLRMGFQTLAIEQRATEVWKVLAAVKTEFGNFGAVLDKVKRQLGLASRTIDETGVRTRAMERKLRSVEQLPGEEATRILELPAPGMEILEDEIERESDDMPI